MQKIEWPFTRDRKDVVPEFGFMCDKPAKTILDHPDKDEGIFTGVAFYIEGLEVVLTQLLAGWNWYVSEWRFHVDGTLRPRFGFWRNRLVRVGHASPSRVLEVWI